nr:hypothetical protein K661_00733 [Piscirickettsia salmonis LF-89 = ATCC VR-1361]
MDVVAKYLGSGRELKDTIKAASKATLINIEMSKIKETRRKLSL